MKSSTVAASLNIFCRDLRNSFFTVRIGDSDNLFSRASGDSRPPLSISTSPSVLPTREDEHMCFFTERRRTERAFFAASQPFLIGYAMERMSLERGTVLARYHAKHHVDLDVLRGCRNRMPFMRDVSSIECDEGEIKAPK